MARGESYEEFVDKFKPKLTTDDCYTPPTVYDAVLGWVRAEYGLSDETEIVRPFWPGGDYEAYEYPDGCVVVDNPPFSIITPIVRFFVSRGIRFFLFAPGLSLLNTLMSLDVCAVCADASIEYENGAIVRTGFLTNLDWARARSAPALCAAVRSAVERLRAEKRKSPPTYSYPAHVVTAAALNYMSAHGVDFRIGKTESAPIRALDEQRTAKKSIFGCGLLLAERAAAERAAAHAWRLSERERRVVLALGEQAGSG